MNNCTKQNYTVVKRDCLEWLREFNDPVKFIHIDASHDYSSVAETIRLVLPNMVKGGVICGDDFIYSNSIELDGGVPRAVNELLPGFASKDNFWYWVNH